MRHCTIALLSLSVATRLLFAQAGPARGFDHAALHARDLAKSADFYEQVLGLQRTTDPFKDDHHVWLQIGPHEQLHLVGGTGITIAARPTTGVAPGMEPHLAFRVASVPAFATRLDQRKIKYHNARGQENAVTVRPDGVKQIYFQDPDGYWIEVNDHK